MSKVVFLDDALSYWAEHTPGATAIRFGAESFSYRALDTMASVIAGRLLETGIQIGDRVAIISAKSPQAIAAINGILRVGAIYVPIDPGAPKDRMIRLLNSTTPSLILADSAAFKNMTDWQTKIPSLELTDQFADLTAIEALEARKQQRKPDDAAYILMTSGSTGEPKGICHTHKSGQAYASMASKLCELTPNDRVSHHTPLHFDMSIFDIFSTAHAGATCIIIPEIYAKVPASLAKLVEDERITVWYSVPFALVQLVERGALESRDLSTLRIVMLAGERIPPSPLKEFTRHVPDALYMNAYGPTETNHCTTATFHSHELDGVSPLPIGLPAHGVSIHITEKGYDQDSGELLISADQVMREYWQDPQRTEDAFVTMPDENGQMQKFYRTGDIVKQSYDGNLTLLGRTDRQIKLRGFRIELDEVELVLCRASGISEAAVIVADDELWAYVTGSNNKDTNAIRTYAAANLPSYAVPARLVAVASLDRTSTGKIDRKALEARRYDDIPA